MEKKKSQKVLAWTTKDVVKTVLNYFFNTVLLAVLFYLSVYLDGLRGANDSPYANPTTFAHFVILLVIIVSVMALYFAFEAKDFMHNQVNTEMIFLILQLSLIVSYACGAYVSEYFRPLAFAALITLFVADRRTAVFINFVFCIMVFLFDSFVTSSFDIGNYPSLIMGFSAGLLATFCMDTVHSRLKLFARSLIVSIPALLSVGMNIIEHGSASFDIGVALACAACSGPLSAIIFSVLLPIFETLFKKVSYFKYSELTDHKAPVIRKLKKNGFTRVRSGDPHHVKMM